MTRHSLMTRSATTRFAAVLGLAAVTLLASCGDETEEDSTERNEEGEITESGDVGVFRINIGDCLNGAAEGNVSQFDGVACTEPHLYEAIHKFDVADGDFDAAAIETASEECLGDVFTEYVGLDYQSSIYGMIPLQPTAESWEQGDREIVCLLTTLDGTTITGSVQGTAQ
jgi:hypothetical protein